MPSTKSRKFGYADDLALLIEVTNFEEGEEILDDDLNVFTHYYTSWRLKPNIDKTEVSVFHLNNKLANKRPCVKFNGAVLSFNIIIIQSTWEISLIELYHLNII